MVFIEIRWVVKWGENTLILRYIHLIRILYHWGQKYFDWKQLEEPEKEEELIKESIQEDYYFGDFSEIEDDFIISLEVIDDTIMFRGDEVGTDPFSENKITQHFIILFFFCIWELIHDWLILKFTHLVLFFWRGCRGFCRGYASRWAYCKHCRKLIE